MDRLQKILIIRFSAIGDIVLTTPVIRAIKKQLKLEVHYITLLKHKKILTLNPYIDKVYAVKSNFNLVLKELKKERYDLIIDLHNNIRSNWLKYRLNVKSHTLRKENWKKSLWIYLGINILKSHIVDRYFGAVEPLNLINDNQGLDFFLGVDYKINFNTDQYFITWCIGASHEQKRLSVDQIVEVCLALRIPIVFLGNKQDKERAIKILDLCNQDNLYNFCGVLSLDESAYMIKESSMLLTNDTSLLHVGAAFNIPLISFWGCTKPNLGFSAYMSNQNSIEIISDLSKKPCSKHGATCRFNQEGCIKKITHKEILVAIKKIYSN